MIEVIAENIVQDLICRVLANTTQLLVTDWLSGRYAPSLEHGLRLQAFLKKRRRSRAQSIKRALIGLSQSRGANSANNFSYRGSWRSGSQ